MLTGDEFEEIQGILTQILAVNGAECGSKVYIPDLISLLN